MTAVPLNNSAAKSIATQQAAQVLIAEYKAAYEAANGRPLNSSISYDRGWFTVKDSSAMFGTRHRRADIERMRDTLLERAAS